MIRKVTRGSRIQGLVAYLFGPGRHEEHQDPHMVAGWEGVLGDGRLSVEEQFELSYDMDAPRVLHDVQTRHKTVWQCALRNHADDRILTDEEWGQLATEAIEAVGLQDCRWVAVRHAADHIHLAVALVRENGTVANPRHDYRKLSQFAAKAELDLGLVQASGRDGAGMPGVGRADWEKAQRENREEPRPVRLERMLRAAAASSRNEAEFVNRAVGEGLLVRPRWSVENEQGDRHVTGLAVAEPEPGEEGTVVWYSAGRLAHDLSLPRLRAWWRGDQDPARDRGAWPGPGDPPASPQEAEPRRELRAETWKESARVIDEVRGQMAQVPAGDEHAWAAAAHQAAGTLAALSRKVEGDRPGQIARAAAAMSAAAQTPYGPRPPAPPAPLQPMWSAARVARDAAIIHAGGGFAGTAVLGRSVGRLIRQIEAGHTMGHYAVQARADRIAGDAVASWMAADIAAREAEARADVEAAFKRRAERQRAQDRQPGRPGRGD